jgi:hypothetical protein
MMHPVNEFRAIGLWLAHRPLLADIGVPMIFVQWPLMFCALLPVILIEAEIVRRRLGLPFRRALGGAAKANVISTLVGVPTAWLLMFVVELVTALPISLGAVKWHWSLDSPVFYFLYALTSAWTGPPVTSLAPIALAAAVLLVPTFFISVRLERPFYRRSYPEIDEAVVDRSVWKANLWSYAVLFVIACVWLGWELSGVRGKAPVMKRVLHEHVIDVAYMHDVAIPNSNQDVRPQLTASVARFEIVLAGFEQLMRDVEQGKTLVRKNFSSGQWGSRVELTDGSAGAKYFDEFGPVSQFEKYGKDGRLVCRWEFNKSGYVNRCSMPPDDKFSFDDKGRLEHWHQEKLNYWGHPGSD